LFKKGFISEQKKTLRHEEGVTLLQRQDMAALLPGASALPRRSRSEATELPVRENSADAMWASEAPQKSNSRERK
jgi:hypothetical protein